MTGSKELPVEVAGVLTILPGPHSALLPSLQYTNTTIIIIIKVKTKSSTVSHESAAGSALLKEGTGYLGASEKHVVIPEVEVLAIKRYDISPGVGT